MSPAQRGAPGGFPDPSSGRPARWVPRSRQPWCCCEFIKTRVGHFQVQEEGRSPEAPPPAQHRGSFRRVSIDNTAAGPPYEYSRLPAPSWFPPLTRCAGAAATRPWGWVMGCRPQAVGLGRRVVGRCWKAGIPQSTRLPAALRPRWPALLLCWCRCGNLRPRMLRDSTPGTLPASGPRAAQLLGRG